MSDEGIAEAATTSAELITRRLAERYDGIRSFTERLCEPLST